MRLQISYDGTDLLGWQETRMGRSAQGEVSILLSQILREEIALQGASRTDRGVHARGQVANFLTHSTIEVERLKRSLNALLSEDIAIHAVEEAEENFHATLHAVGKEYHYHFCSASLLSPHERRFCWQLFAPEFDPLLASRAASMMEGERDFASFRNTRPGEPLGDSRRNLFSCRVEELAPERYRFILRGDRFLYRMARNIVGTLIDIGRGRLALEALPDIFARRSRAAAGLCADAKGLFLEKVFYQR